MSRSTKMFVLALAAILALVAGTATAAKVINGRSIKNGTITERKLTTGVRDKLNAPGPQGPRGTPGEAGPRGETGAPGEAAPAVGSATAQTAAIAPLALGSVATILTLTTPSGAGTGLLTATRPTRLLITGQVNAFKTTGDFDKFARVHCQLLHENRSGLETLGNTAQATLGPVPVGAVLTSVSLVGSVDVDAGQHDVGIRCEASTASTNAGVSFSNASLHVVAVPL